MNDFIKAEENLFCRVCGFRNETPPWGDDGCTPLYDYCPCCGVEHGYQDAHYGGVKAFREEWIDSGAQWYDPTLQPDNWNLQKQLAQVPNKFR